MIEQQELIDQWFRHREDVNNPQNTYFLIVRLNAPGQTISPAKAILFASANHEEVANEHRMLNELIRFDHHQTGRANYELRTARSTEEMKSFLLYESLPAQEKQALDHIMKNNPQALASNRTIRICPWTKTYSWFHQVSDYWSCLDCGCRVAIE